MIRISGNHIHITVSSERLQHIADSLKDSELERAAAEAGALYKRTVFDQTLVDGPVMVQFFSPSGHMEFPAETYQTSMVRGNGCQ